MTSDDDSQDMTPGEVPGAALDSGEVDEAEFRRRYTTLLEGHEEILEELRAHRAEVPEKALEISEVDSRYDELIDECMSSLEELRKLKPEFTRPYSAVHEYHGIVGDQFEELEDLHSDYRNLMEEHERIVDQLMSEKQELEEDYAELLIQQRDTVPELASHKLRAGANRAIAGLALIAGGLLSAEAYPLETGIIDFYASTPEVYFDDPEFALLTLGLPAAGLYSFKKAYDYHQDYEDLERRASALRREREEQL